MTTLAREVGNAVLWMSFLFCHVQSCRIQMQGVYAKRKDTEPILRQLGSILEEEPAHPSTFETKQAVPADVQSASNPAQASPEPSPGTQLILPPSIWHFLFHYGQLF